MNERPSLLINNLDQEGYPYFFKDSTPESPSSSLEFGPKRHSIHDNNNHINYNLIHNPSKTTSIPFRKASTLGEKKISSNLILDSNEKNNRLRTESTPLLLHYQPETAKQNFWTLLLITFWTLGTNFTYASILAYGNPVFLKFNVHPFFQSLAWVSGPVSGLLVKPIFGALSDRSANRYGRRRPYLFAGLIITLVGMTLFANANGDARLFHLKEKAYAVIFSLSSLWVVFIGLNMIQFAGWALVFDQAPFQQPQANALLQALASFSAIGPCLINFLDVRTVLDWFSSNQEASYYCSMALLVLSVLPTLFFPETPLVIDEEELQPSFFGGIYQAVKQNFPSLKWVFVLFFFLNAIYAPVQFYYLDYFARDIYDGNPSASKDSDTYRQYHEGIKYGSLGLTFSLFVAVIWALGLTRLQKGLGIHFNLYISFLTAGFSFLVPLIFSLFHTSIPVAKVVGLTWVSLLGITNSVSNIIPFAIVGSSISADHSGLFIGLLTIAQVTAQVISVIVVTGIQQLTSLGSGLAIFGIVFSVLGILVVNPIETPDLYFGYE